VVTVARSNPHLSKAGAVLCRGEFAKSARQAVQTSFPSGVPSGGHLRREHSAAMAQKVTFGQTKPENVLPMPKEATA
jgi:hypothetical protein